jgi:hypothetical protein
MDFLIQLLMGVSLAACAGLRAWMPLLITGLLGRTGYLHLHPSFELLAQDGTLIALGVATILEVLGDKIIAIDHLLDAIGTFVRPAAGTILAASVLTGMDPLWSLILGIIVGGGAAMTVHAGKSAVRAGTSALAPAHLGTGNAAVSLVEDVLAFGGIVAAILVPALAFVAIATTVWWVNKVVARARRRGIGVWRAMVGR